MGGTKSTSGWKAACAVMLVGILAFPATAHAEQTIKVSNHGTATVTHTYMSNEDPPEVPETIIDNGKEYRLSKTGERKIDNTYEKPVGYFTRDLTAKLSNIQAENPQAHAAPTMAIDVIQDGIAFKGTIGLLASPVRSITESREKQVDKPYTINGGLTSNDLEHLAAYGTMDFTTTSDEYVGATTVQTLACSSVEPFIVATDGYGVPTEYGANLVYRGTERYRVITGYDVTYQYAGNITGDIERYIVEAEYEEVEPVVEPVAVAIEPEPEAFNIWSILGPLFAAIAAGGGGIFAFFFIRRKPRLCKTETGKVITVERLKVTKGSLEDIITTKTQIYENPVAYIVVAPRHYSKRRQTLTINSGDYTVYQGRWKNHIEILGQEVITDQHEKA